MDTSKYSTLVAQVSNISNAVKNVSKEVKAVSSEQRAFQKEFWPIVMEIQLALQKVSWEDSRKMTDSKTEVKVKEMLEQHLNSCQKGQVSVSSVKEILKYMSIIVPSSGLGAFISNLLG